MKRRALLSTAGTALVLGLSGCASDSVPVSQSNSETQSPSPPSSRGTRDSETPHRTSQTYRPVEPPFEPIIRLGGASSATISAEPVREYEYLDGENEVRVQYNSDSDTIPFDEWGTLWATDHASQYVRDRLREKSLLEEAVFVAGGIVDLDELTETSANPPSESMFERDREIGPTVNHSTMYDRQGALVSSPEVAFEALVEATPRTMEVSMKVPEGEYTAILPVLCSKRWAQYV